VLIVDDEPIARNVLRQELDGFAEVEVVGEADNGEKALLQISELQPDIVFLDIQMPVMGGFELLNQLSGDRMPAIVMVTAFDRHAIRAFEAGTVDYLLKPVSQARLQQAVDRAARLHRNPPALAEDLARLQQIAAGSSAESRIRKIVGKAGEEFFLLDPGRSPRLSSQRRPGLDRHQQATLSCHAKHENTRRTFDQWFLPPCAP